MKFRGSGFDAKKAGNHSGYDFYYDNLIWGSTLMPMITFLPSGKKHEVPEGTLLFEAAQQAGLPVASSCSAGIVCGKCVMRVVEGGESLSPLSQWERKLLLRDKRKPDERISCMARVGGACTVTTGYW